MKNLDSMSGQTEQKHGHIMVLCIGMTGQLMNLLTDMSVGGYMAITTLLINSLNEQLVLLKPNAC